MILINGLFFKNFYLVSLIHRSLYGFILGIRFFITYIEVNLSQKGEENFILEKIKFLIHI